MKSFCAFARPLRRVLGSPSRRSQGLEARQRFAHPELLEARVLLTAFPAVADTFARDGSSAATNYGLNAQVQSKNDVAGSNRHGYLRFDTAAFAGSVGTAKLRLYGGPTHSDAVPVNVHAVADTAWSETALNWNNKPAMGGSVLASATVQGAADGWYEWDVTSYVQQQKSGGIHLLSLGLKNPNVSVPYAHFNSDEAGSNKPELVLTPAAQSIVVSSNAVSVPEGGSASFTVKLGAQPSSDVTLTVAKQSGGDADLTAAPASLTFTNANWNTPQTVTVAAAQDADGTPGAASFVLAAAGLTSQTIAATEVDDDLLSLAPSADAYVLDGSPSANYGQDPELRVKYGISSNTRESFLKFPLSAVPSVGSAVLRVFGSTSTNTGTLVVNGHSSTGQSWAENTITWNTRPTNVSGVLDTVTVATTTDQWYEFDVSGFVQQQKQAGATDVTLVLRGQANSDPYAIFDSKESANTGAHPRLVVLPAPPTATISIGDASAQEGNSGTTAFGFTATRTGDTSGTQVATFTVSGQTADGIDIDFATGEVAFGPGETSKPIVVTVNGDATVESDETFLVTLTAPTNGAALGDAQGVGTILNDDAGTPTPTPTAPTFSIAAVSQQEGNSGTTAYGFTATRGGDTSGTNLVAFSVTSQTADGTDVSLASGQVGFAPGETSKPIVVNVNGDNSVEPNEAFLVTLTNPANGEVLGDGPALGTIVNDDMGSPTPTPTPSATPPAVAQVLVDSTLWVPAFRDHLAATGQGSDGYGIGVGSEQLNELPWTGVNQLKVRFTEDVTVQQDDLVVHGVKVPAYAFSGFAYDPHTFTATWTLSAALGADKLALELDADAATGVTDAAGNRLDGEWVNGADTFNSGDGTPGGDFRLRVNVLPGDVNRNGTVSATDMNLVKMAQGVAPGTAPYTVYKDVNGSGTIFANDVTLVRGLQGTALPAGDPGAPSGVPAPAPTNVIARPNGAWGLDVSWDAVAGTGITYNIYVSTNAGFTPGAGTLAASGLLGTSDTVTGLSPGTAYYVLVTAVATGGGSAAGGAESATAAANGGAGTATPSAPQTGEWFSQRVYDLWDPTADDASGVTHEWSEPEASLTAADHHNETVTLTLSGLPEHQGLQFTPLTPTRPGQDFGQVVSASIDGVPAYIGSPYVNAHTATTVTLTLTGTGFTPAMTSWIVSATSVSLYRQNARIVGGGATGENGAPVTFTVQRDGTFPDAMKEDLTVQLERSGDADPEDFIESFPTSVTIPKDQYDVSFTLTPKDEAETESPEGGPPVDENVTFAVKPGAKYTPIGNPASATIAEDASWFYTDWALKANSKPDPMRTPTYYLGAEDKRGLGPEYKPTPGDQGYIERYFYYDQWIPQFDQAKQSASFEDENNDVSWGYEVGFSSGTSFGFNVGGEVGGQGGSVNFTIFDLTKTNESSQTTTWQVDVDASQDEKVRVIPLLLRRTIIIMRENHIYEGNLDGTYSWNYHTTDRLEHSGYLKQYTKAVFSIKRHCLDEEHGNAQGLRAFEPPTGDETFANMLDIP